jgi:hypothetical protein
MIGAGQADREIARLGCIKSAESGLSLGISGSGLVDVLGGSGAVHRVRPGAMGY